MLEFLPHRHPMSHGFDDPCHKEIYHTLGLFTIYMHLCVYHGSMNILTPRTLCMCLWPDEFGMQGARYCGILIRGVCSLIKSTICPCVIMFIVPYPLLRFPSYLNHINYNSFIHEIQREFLLYLVWKIILAGNWSLLYYKSATSAEFWQRSHVGNGFLAGSEIVRKFWPQLNWF